MYRYNTHRVIILIMIADRVPSCYKDSVIATCKTAVNGSCSCDIILQDAKIIVSQAIVDIACSSGIHVCSKHQNSSSCVLVEADESISGYLTHKVNDRLAIQMTRASCICTQLCS